ncbi:MAG TPA: RagB/SusD family nutrient uptake outer membrane protein, partial [Cytophagales bacterium]|nr:RagB/SusD family nutrient uptake outer membrane protein [Cytophagales bacterium]
MKNKIITLIITAVFFGCADQLDIAPVNSVESSSALKTSKDVEALLVGAYALLGDGDVLGGNMQRDAELIGDDGEMFWDGTFVDPGQIFIKKLLITNGQAELTWLEAYETINAANTVLNNLNVVVSTKKDKVEGEAKFIRALTHFELVRVYAKTYTDGNPANNPGIPLALTPDNLEPLNRSTVQQVYTQIIQDLTDAVNLLPETNGFFATTYTASAILSRVYLMQNDYAKARDAAHRVIASGKYSLLSDYANNFNNSSNGSSNATAEDVFSIQVTNQAGINNMNTFFASSDFGGRGDIYVEPAHLALYDPADERLALFYDDERTGKWNNQFGNVNIVRLSEMYLTRAEGNFREGTALGQAPLDDINFIRNRAGLTTPLASVTIDDILLERHLELAFEGHLIHDIKRTQRSVGALPYNDPSLVFPIPNRERLINSGLVQNE